MNSMKIKVGIFFGGPSREREISFAGGRTVYDNLNRTLFEPVPIFIDSNKNFILLNWEFIYKGSIRDFYPPVDQLPASPNGFQVYLESLGHLSTEQQDALIRKVGKKIDPSELTKLISIAFLALHGEYGEDGALQKELEALEIPYTGSGVIASQVGMNKALQKEMMVELGFPSPKVSIIERQRWFKADLRGLYEEVIEQVGFPMVIRPANQGSSIGVSILEHDDLEGFKEAINNAFFRELLPVSRWNESSPYQKAEHIRLLTDIRIGVGFPMDVTIKSETYTIYHPEQLLSFLDQKSQGEENSEADHFILEGHHSEQTVIVEEFIHGKEFSCIVLRKEDDSAVALPPTEIVKGQEVFDYRAKYMPGFSRKVTPINLPEPAIESIREECVKLFDQLAFQTYARIDGFYTNDGQIFLNDPNTTSGMLPSSFFFHQAAEIGLNPSQFLTCIIRTSLQERIKESESKASYENLLYLLDDSIKALKEEAINKQKIGVFLGGFSFERHISVESGRNIFEKLSSSDKYEPVPIFLTGNANNIELYQLPINLLLKDNADDIRDKINTYAKHPLVEKIKEQCKEITDKYASIDVVFEPVAVPIDSLGDRLDFAFIALHGRPGEDGHLQEVFEKMELPYNGSGVQSSSITIDKYKTLQVLKRNGFTVTDQMLLSKSLWAEDREAFYKKIAANFTYPFITKPVDDGCSSAVKVIRKEEELKAYTELMFRNEGADEIKNRKALKLRPKEEFPQKENILFEGLIHRENEKHFLEVTGGLLTGYRPDGTLFYEVFEPSETLASGDVLSLEEKFLAGEGQNITPARFAKSQQEYRYIADQVKADLENVARTLNIQGYARIDAFVRIFEDNSVETIVVEVNSLPGMTPATCIFHQAAINGYRPYNFIEQIIEFGKRRFVQRVGREDAKLATSLSMINEALEEEQNLQEEEPASLSQIEQPIQKVPNKIEDNTEKQDDKEEKPVEEQSLVKKLWSAIWGFFSSSYFLRNAGAMLGILILFLFLTRWGLNVYTHHGETQEVEKFEGKTLTTAYRLAKDRGLRLEIMDSVYIRGRQPNMVIEQTPKVGAEVKSNRTIYLVVTKSTPPNVQLPDLVGSDDYNQYTRKLEELGVDYKIRERVFDRKLEENTILYLFYNDKKIEGRDLQKGINIPKGSTVEFVVTRRFTGSVPIPSLVCKRYREAVFLLDGNNLAVGNVTTNLPRGAWDEAFVSAQNPGYEVGLNVSTGTQINLTLSPNRPAGCSGGDVIDQAKQIEEQF